MVVPSAMVLEGGDDVQVEGEGGGGGKSISCSICLEAIADDDGRSWAKLQCGHEFHLDCIGSAFNVKGAMQCPNCRKIEKGQWLYANGCRSIPEFSMDDWTHDEDLYDLSYTDVAFHWCPFGQLPRVPPSFEDGDFPAAAMAYHDVQHAIFAEHSAIPPAATHPCPYVAYLGPMHPSGSSSSSSISMTDGTNFPSHHWNGGPPNEVPSSFSFSPAMDHFFRHGWEPPFSTSNSRADQQPQVPSVVQRSNRTGADGSRSGSGSFMHPFFVGPLSPGALSGTSLAPIPPSLYPGSNARSRDRVQALQAYYQQQQQPTNLPPPPTMHAAPMMSTTRRSNGHRGSTSSAEQSNGGGFFFVPTSSSSGPENPVSARFHSWDREPSPSSFTLNVGGGQVERDSGWGSILHPSPDPSGQMPGFRPRPHGSDRAPSQHR